MLVLSAMGVKANPVQHSKVVNSLTDYIDPGTVYDSLPHHFFKNSSIPIGRT
jgi:hypothetical protein